MVSKPTCMCAARISEGRSRWRRADSIAFVDLLHQKVRPEGGVLREICTLPGSPTACAWPDGALYVPTMAGIAPLSLEELSSPIADLGRIQRVALEGSWRTRRSICRRPPAAETIWSHAGGDIAFTIRELGGAAWNGTRRSGPPIAAATAAGGARPAG